jgi:uncharacterized protein (DUF1501 family)
MNRRFFLKNTLTASVLSSLAITGGLRYYSLSQDTKSTRHNNRILVLIQLDGGNDGLNTIIPLDQYSRLMAVRKNILIPDKLVLPLNDRYETGFHPSMNYLQEMYNNGTLAIIQGVGYPNSSYSHFRSADVWLTGSDSDTILDTGWLGRFLNVQYPGFPNGYPTDSMPDPPAIQVGSYLSTALQGPSAGMGMAITTTTSFYDLVLDTYNPVSHSPADYELKFMKSIANETQRYTSVIKRAVASQKNRSSLYPPVGANKLADQLKIVAQLIGGGLQTQVYMVNLEGFDTHGGQVDKSNHARGAHGELLSQLSTAIAAFQDDLRIMKKDNDVIGMTFSEFGRRIKSNASSGTDHGTTGPVLLFGSQVKGGIIGTNPIIPDKATVDDNLLMQTDYRAIYKSILKKWFGQSDTVLECTLPGKYQMLDLFKMSSQYI